MKRLLILILVFPLAVASCELPFPLFYWWDKITAPYPVEHLSFEEGSRMSRLGWAIYTLNVEQVREYLKEGYDPDQSYDEEGWMSRNPLNMVARNFYDTFNRKERGESIPNPPPDVAILELLVASGADVNRRPFIWIRVYNYDNSLMDQIINDGSFISGSEAEIEYKNKMRAIQNARWNRGLVEDANRVLEAFLKAGADPDMRGHPVPFGARSDVGQMTDERAAKYFARGTRPVNEAIKKGMRWESQVDLLLQYTTLDKDSLKAARQSKDKAMVEKITRLWEKQEAGK